MILFNAATAASDSNWRNIRAGVYKVSTYFSGGTGTVTLNWRADAASNIVPVSDEAGTALSHTASKMTTVRLPAGQVRATIATPAGGAQITTRVDLA